MSTKRNRVLSYVALAVSCVMIGSGLTMASAPKAVAENPVQSVVVTSPFTAAVAEVRPSVVGVSRYEMVNYSNYSNGFGNFYFGYGFGGPRNNAPAPQTKEQLAATGSGVVVADQLVLTNYHVVEDADRLTLSIMDYDTNEMTTVAAGVVAYDEANDLALLYAPDLTLAPVTLGNSDQLLVGDWAICIGNPLGENFFGTVTTGVISSLNRSVSSTSYDKYGRRQTNQVQMIQTDAAINSGNSGGGMFNVQGELMGIPSRKYSATAYSSTQVDGIGMCIPINIAKPLIEEVLDGNVPLPQVEALPEDAEKAAGSAAANNDLTGKPRLGVTIGAINPNSTAVLTGQLPNGVYVNAVEDNSPAAQGGMMAGDIIVDVDDTVITSVSQLQGIIAEHQSGDTLQIKVYRVPGMTDITTAETIPDGDYVDLQVTLAVIDLVAQ